MPAPESNLGLAIARTASEDEDAHTPALISPPDTKTPPTAASKRQLSAQKSNGHGIANGNGHGSREVVEAVDPNALSKALGRIEQAGRREITPNGSPSRKRQRVYADRFIPNRSGQDFAASFSLLHDEGSPATPSKSNRRVPHHELHFQKNEEANRTYSSLLRSELFDDTVPQARHEGTTSLDPTRSKTPPGRSSLPTGLTPSTPSKNLFSYGSRSVSGQPTPSRTPQGRRGPNMDTRAEIYSLSPVKHSSQTMLLSPRKTPRVVSKVPYKVLDAPDLADDFYLNLVDWGNQNILGVGLGSCVYMWNSTSGRVTKLCELPDDTVTSVNWIQRGSHVAIGTNKGFVQIWDAAVQRRLRTMTGHTARVGALAWNEHILTSGSRDRLIYHRDVRQPEQWLRKLAGHKQEVCGLKWNTEDGQLASGGNDNKLMVWDKLNAEPTYKWSEHSAAVKAIAWSPHQRGLLASGGGTADRTIKFWNTLGPAHATNSVTNYMPNPVTSPSLAPATPVSPNLISSYDTGSQVCNLAWSRNSNEIVSTHGYSQNQIIVWKYPSMQQVVSLTGHTYRVLYLAMSPDGQVIVTGAGDETLRFWQAFKKKERAGGLGMVENWGVIR